MADINHSKTVKDSLLGNGLSAQTALSSGDLIVKINDPYLVVVENAALDRVCSQCLLDRGETDLKRCSRCRVARYCSSTCQAVSWKSFHSKECSSLKSLSDIPPTPVRALALILLRHKYGLHPDPIWLNLLSHSEQLKRKERWDDVVLQAKAALEFTKSPADWFDIAVMVLCQMSANAFRVTLPDNTPVGLCFEPQMALANHSCWPNAVMMFDGRRLSVRALNDIKQDEQVFISYIDPTEDRESRRAKLQERYFFQCNCEKCLGQDSPYRSFQKIIPTSSHNNDLLCDWNALRAYADARVSYESTAEFLELQSLRPTYTDIQDLVEPSKATSVNQSQRLQALKLALGKLAILKRHQLLAVVPYPSVLYEIYLCYLDNAEYLSALIVVLFIYFSCDVFNYPQPHHPVRVIRLFTIARLMKLIASIESTVLHRSVNFVPEKVICSIDYVSAVHALLILVADYTPKSHGRESRFMAQVEEELREVEEVQRLRGSSGETLRAWQINSEAAVKGRGEIAKLFAALRMLSGYAFTVIEKKIL